MGEIGTSGRAKEQCLRALLSFEVRSDPEALADVRRFVEEFCQQHCHDVLSDHAGHLLALAVNEALTNIIRHAYQGRQDGTVQIEAQRSEEEVRFGLYDLGSAFPGLSAIPPPVFDGSREGGFGIYIMQRCVDDVRYSRDEKGRNAVTLIKRLDQCRQADMSAES
jgi:anti-sigma regulatory factor (Ser/Thr protein kinase)